MALAGSRSARNRPPFWQQSLLEGKHGTSGGSRQALALHGGRTSAWKLHYVPAVGFAVATSKNNLGRMMFVANTMQIIWNKALFEGFLQKKAWAGAMNCAHGCIEGEKNIMYWYSINTPERGTLSPKVVCCRVSPCFFRSLRCIRDKCLFFVMHIETLSM